MAILAATRPTAINLRWALEEMRRTLQPLPPGERVAAAYRRAAALCDEDVAINRGIGTHGLRLHHATIVAAPGAAARGAQLAGNGQLGARAAAVFLRGFTEAITIAVGLVAVYLTLNLIVIAVGLWEIATASHLIVDWRHAMTAEHGSPWMMIAIALIVFPKLALGMSGFETGVAVMPQIRGAADDTERITAAGEKFVMNMHGDHMGGDYKTDNHVTGYAKDKLLAWQTAPAGTEPPGWEWLWELEAQGPNETLVRHTYDWSKVTDKDLLKKVSFPLVTEDQMAQTIDKVADAATVWATIDAYRSVDRATSASAEHTESTSPELAPSIARQAARAPCASSASSIATAPQGRWR